MLLRLSLPEIHHRKAVIPKEEVRLHRHLDRKSGRLVIRENGTLQLGGAEMNYRLEGNVMHLENKTNKSDVELNLKETNYPDR
ncbi:MAG: hypothetical protein IPJ66_13470 [Bacteroidetes bacterium]|nr:hypothetical protein [Bacteroidota bacterium]